MCRCQTNEGNGGDGGSKGDGYNNNVYDGGNGGFGLISIKSKYITVTPGQSITRRSNKDNMCIFYNE
jgi:hypothetical protein